MPGVPEWIYLFCSSFGFMQDRLYPLEECLFRKLFEVLPDDKKEVFYKQLACYRIFQRGSWWRTLTMFPMRHFWQPRGRDYFPVELRVPTEQTDIKLASFRFSVSEHENNAVFHVVNGHLFSIEFGKDYRPIRFAPELEVIRYKVNRSI